MGVKKQVRKTSTTEYYCHSCGTKLTEENSRYEGSPYCLDCESKTYDELRQKNGESLALFFTCLKYDVPLYPLLLSEDLFTADDIWLAYIDLLDKNDKLLIGERAATFSDGETNLFRIFGKNMQAKDFSEFCKREKERLDKLPGTAEQRTKWGERNLWQNFPITTAVYNELDTQYDAMASRYKGVTIDDTMESTIRRVVKLRVVQDYLQSIGDAGSFDKVQKSIDSILASEQLRKKDEKPVEALRLDSMVLALENAGLMQNGDLLTYDELIEVFRDKFVKSPKYKYSLDVADQVILDIMNSMRKNADEPTLINLPEEYAAVDEYGEFEPKETEQEKEAKRYAGLTKVQIEKADKKRKNGGEE